MSRAGYRISKLSSFMSVAHYTGAALIVASAYVLRWALTLAVGPGLPPFIFSYPAVMTVAVLWGMGPGLLATVVASAFTAIWVLPSQGHTAAVWAADALSLSVFACMGVFMSIVAAVFHRARQRAAAVTALQESEKRLRGTLDHMMEGCQIIGRDWRYLYVNDMAVRHSLLTKEELLGRTMMEVYPGIDRTPMFAAVRRCMEERVPGRVENEFTYADGSSSWFDLSFQPAPEGLFILSYDITSRRHVQEEIEKLNAGLERRVQERTVELRATNKELEEASEAINAYAKEVSDLYMNAPCGYHSLDGKGTMLRVNDTELRMLGYTREEVVGRINIRSLLTPASRQVFEANFPNFIEKGRIDNLELDFVGKDGSVLPVLLSGTAVRDEQGAFVISRSTIIDNAEKKHLIEELQEAKRVAEEANLAKSSFLANMSHEIRTPMNAVIGFSNLALKTGLSPQQRDYISKIHGAGVSLLGVINDILDFSKIEAGRLVMEQADFSLDSVIERLTSFTGHNAFAKGLEFLVNVPADIPALLVGDAHRLGQVLTNLVGNSVKFTDRGEVELRVTLLELTGEKAKLRFSVRDTGIGMTEEQSSRLFQPFSQADSSMTRKFGGTGLGLSISRRLVELMGGQIWVQSAPAVGSTFTFTAWFGVGKENHTRHPFVPGTLDGMRVLVVDDNPCARDLMHDILESLRFRVLVAASGGEAIETVSSEDSKDPFTLVLMDWRMPEMDGIEATRRILAPQRLRNPPVVIVLSASGGGEEERASAIEAGAKDFLGKPVTPSTLVDAILKIFSPELIPELLARPAKDGSCRKAQGARVLLVEDNEINQQIAMELLRGEGAAVVLAHNGREAIEKLVREQPQFDLVLMDVQMPEMDGYEATRRIRAEPWGSRVPIIAMTAHALIEERKKALEAGMNDHISKPIDPEAMFATINRYFTPDGNLDKATAASPSGVVEVPLPRIDGIDMEGGLRRVSGNSRLLMDLLVRFADAQDEAAEQITAALGSGDKELARRLAHTIKGSAGNLGVREAENAAGELELRIRNDAPPREVEESRRRLASILEGAVARIRAALPGDAPAVTARLSLHPRELEPTLAHLATLITESDSTALDFFEEEAARLAAAYQGEELNGLRDCLRAFDFTGASEVLALLRPRVAAERGTSWRG